MILEFDAGNSRIKWRELALGGHGVLTEGVACNVTELIQAISTVQKPDFVRLCSVKGETEVDEIRHFIATNWNLELHIAQVSRSCGGVSNQYADIHKLGIDRWLAMLAAFQKAAGSCIVVDAGTALTIDVVDAQGNHDGGFILPGLRLMRESLQAHTAIRLTEAAIENSLELGHSTDAAVCNGTLATVVAIIERVAATEHEGVRPRLYFTGGDAHLLSEKCSLQQIEVVTGLVLDGLAVACPYSPASSDAAGS